MTEQERLNTLKVAAWDARDLDLFEFYVGIEQELKHHRMISKVIARMYLDGSDAVWTALFEALSDAGLFDETEKDEATK